MNLLSIMPVPPWCGTPSHICSAAEQPGPSRLVPDARGPAGRPAACLPGRTPNPEPELCAGSGHPEGFELGSLAHPKVVNSAYFSPRTGGKLLTTCIDNRLRVWDSWAAGSAEPSRQMVHSHDFNRRGPEEASAQLLQTRNVPAVHAHAPPGFGAAALLGHRRNFDWPAMDMLTAQATALHLPASLAAVMTSGT